MQSTARMLQRGNAVIVFSEVTKQLELVVKRGTWWKEWENAQKRQLPDEAMKYRAKVKRPTHRINHGEKPAKHAVN